MMTACFWIFSNRLAQPRLFIVLWGGCSRFPSAQAFNVSLSMSAPLPHTLGITCGCSSNVSLHDFNLLCSKNGHCLQKVFLLLLPSVIARATARSASNHLRELARINLKASKPVLSSENCVSTASLVKIENGVAAFSRGIFLLLLVLGGVLTKSWELLTSRHLRGIIPHHLEIRHLHCTVGVFPIIRCPNYIKAENGRGIKDANLSRQHCAFINLRL